MEIALQKDQRLKQRGNLESGAWEDTVFLVNIGGFKLDGTSVRGNPDFHI